MTILSPQALLRYGYRGFLQRFSNTLELEDFQKSAIVFSPHQDDETLGCGGTIFLKKKAGAKLKVVYMTDGSKSHNRLIAEDELKAIRVKEAIAACAVLGVDEKDVIFLNYEDGRLSDSQEAATHDVAEVLWKYQPEQVFIPYYKEGHLDHVMTNSVVLSALRTCRINAIVYEYPVWFWFHWPWVGFSGERWEIKAALKNTLSAWFGLRLLKDFRYSTKLASTGAVKRKALEQHRTQMTQYLPNPEWMTLADVAKGRFLECFFQEDEFFYRHSLENGNSNQKS